MEIFNELKEFVSDKYGKLKTAITGYQQTKREKKETAKMQFLLHTYFDLGGIGMSNEEISKVNAFILENMVLYGTREINNFQSLMNHLTILDGGRDSLKKDRERVISELKSGKVVSKSDACMAAQSVILYKSEIKNFYYNNDGEMIETVIRPKQVYGISVDPDKSNGVSLTKYSPAMEKIAEKFKKVKATAFTKSVEQVKEGY